MTYALDDTIAAIASAPGGAARGVVRLSGPQVAACLQAVFHADDARLLEAHRRPARIEGQLTIESPPLRLPCQLLFWPGRASYTREPVAELHTLGSPPLLEAALHAVCTAGARLARPGEFTLRAFLAGRVDLTQAEAVLGVIDAESDAQLRTALAQLAGGLAAPLGRLRSSLLDLLADLEAGLDFVEDDIAFVERGELLTRLESRAAELGRLQAQLDARGAAGELPRVVLCGAPNVGKSSLFNALGGRDRALVTDVAGTTRDYLTVELQLGDLRCLLVDTAGVSHTLPEDELDRAAQSTADRQRLAADVELLCLDATRAVSDWERAQQLDTQRRAAHRIVVLTKTDRIDADGSSILGDVDVRAIPTSSKTGVGVDELRARLNDELASMVCLSGAAVPSTGARCRESLDRAAQALARAAELAAADRGDELVAAEIRAALDELGHVVGAVYTDDLLDRIFSRFCIGK